MKTLFKLDLFRSEYTLLSKPISRSQIELERRRGAGGESVMLTFDQASIIENLDSPLDAKYFNGESSFLPIDTNLRCLFVSRNIFG